MAEMTQKEMASMGGKAVQKIHGPRIVNGLLKKFDGLTEEQKQAFMSGVRSGKTYAQIRQELHLDTD